MKKCLALVLGSITAFSAVAANFEDYARVVSVQEQYRNNGGGRQVCDNQQQQQGNDIGAGTAIGAVAGGLLGAQVGKGKGRVAASAGGAVVGALAGHYVENNRQTNNGGSRCYTTGGDSRPSGYLVTYEYNGRTYTDTFTNPPSDDVMKVRVNVTPASYR